jgi:hypothetical protein
MKQSSMKSNNVLEKLMSTEMKSIVKTLFRDSSIHN